MLASAKNAILDTLSTRFLPFVSWGREYNLNKGIADFGAGLTVAIILIPQAMAYAMLAGLPPIHGLYAGVLGACIASLFGSSTRLSTGPVAIVSFLTLSVLSELAVPESGKFIALAALLALLVGIIKLTIGIFRLGFILSFVANPITVGFMNAAAIVIISTQIPSLLGVKVDQHSFLFQNIADLFLKVPEAHWLTIFVGLFAILAILFLRKIHRLFPATLVVVVLGTFISMIFDISLYGVNVVGNVPAGLPLFSLPAFSFSAFHTLFGAAIAISIVSSVETATISRSLAAKTRQKIDVNQEFVGQGLANIAAAFFRGFPVSGSISRSAVNHLSGAQTNMAGIAAGLFVLLALLFITPYLYHLPRAVLAAIIVMAVWDLINIEALRRPWKIDRDDGIVTFVTFGLALITRPDYAIYAGVILSLGLFLKKTMKPSLTIEMLTPEEEALHAHALVIRPDRSLYFANITYVLEGFDRMLHEKKDTDFFIIDMKGVSVIDVTAVEELMNYVREKKEEGVNLHFFNLNDNVYRILENAHMKDLLPEGGLQHARVVPISL